MKKIGRVVLLVMLGFAAGNAVGGGAAVSPGSLTDLQALTGSQPIRVPGAISHRRSGCAGARSRRARKGPAGRSSAGGAGRRPGTASCFVAVGAATKQAAKRRLLIVDVRDARDFAKYRIAGSLNIPLHAIKTKRFLKTKAFALANEGRDTVDLASACVELKRAGFGKVSVLRGGLYAWRQQNGFLAGDAVAQKGLDRMLPGEYAQEKRYGNWAVIDASGGDRREARRLFPRAVVLGPPQNERKFVRGFKVAVRKKAQSAGNVNVLVFNADGENYERMENLLRPLRGYNILYLKGGLAGYQRYVRRQRAMWRHIDNPPPKRKGCGAS